MCIRDSPPAHRREALQALAAVDPPQPAVAAGDINLQLHAPRDPREVEDAELWRVLMGRWGLEALEFNGATRGGRRDSSSIDVVAVAPALSGAWEAKPRWQHGLSDHAAMVVGPSYRA
eukprot:4093957-Alexandrium_andersonii.AAC.1